MIDLPIALSIFLIFLLTTVVFAINYFVDLPKWFKINELRSKAEDFYDTLFKTKGKPTDWEDSVGVPAMPGVMIDLRKVPVLVEEQTGISRIDEPIVVNITFDEDCLDTTWNNTVRVYDSNMSGVSFNLTEQSFCPSNFLKNANVTFSVNISANENKKYEIYFSDDDSISASNNTIIYNTASWNPNSGDEWTESTTDWSRYSGSSGTVVMDTTNKKIGTGSVNITGALDSQELGLEYRPESAITGVSNGWYFRAWLLINDTSDMTDINVSLDDGSEIITVDVSGDMNNNNWYLFEKNISSTNWANWSSFDASDGIKFVRFFAYGTNGLTRILKIDGVRFEKHPLTTTVFPEENIKAISPSKTKGLRNITSDELTAIGEGYKFRVEIEQK